MMEIKASATIGGKKTNRVKLNGKPVAAKPREPKRYRKDQSIVGRDYTVVCISLPIDELRALDAVAERAQMARSHLIRQAVRHLTEQLKGGPETTADGDLR